MKAVAAGVANAYDLHVEVRSGGGLDAWVRDPETGWHFVSVEAGNKIDYTGKVKCTHSFKICQVWTLLNVLPDILLRIF